MSEPGAADQPALIGGLIVGLLSVLPLVQAANACCCLWAWVGGATTAKLYIDRSPQRVSWAEAARIASIAGLLGAVMRVFIGTPIELATFPASLRAMEELAKSMADPQKQRLLEMVSTLQDLSNGPSPVTVFIACQCFRGNGLVRLYRPGRITRGCLI